jgi:hypothetical protein
MYAARVRAMVFIEIATNNKRLRMGCFGKGKGLGPPNDEVISR